jgi:hypothetical protein
LGKTLEDYTKGPLRSRKIIRFVLIMLISGMILLLVIRLLSGLHKLVILPVKKVQIYGTEFVDNNRILEAVKLDAARSIFSINKMRAKSALLKDKRIKGVEIAKIYPDTLKIYIAEEEAGMLLNVDDRWYIMNAGGVVLDEIDVPDKSTIPLISLNLNIDDISIGSSVDNFMVHDIVESMQKLNRLYPDFYKTVESFSVNDDGVYVFMKNSDHSIYFGSTVTAEKLEKLRALLLVLNSRYKDGSGSGWEIDMSFSQAAVRKREFENESR